MRALAAAELAAAEAQSQAMSRAIRISLLPKDAADEGDAILEIRAGTGGDEAALFAGDLFRMYVKYAESKRWKVDVLSMSEGTAGGYKEIVAQISGRGVFARLKFESGVHRVQRVPATETQGRIHTSAATVAVLPVAEEADFVINEADLKIDTMRSSGAGGQHVNKTESAIRITHLPTGVVVAMQEERSQHRNRAKAMALLRSRILDARNQKLDAERAQERRSQVGSGDRSQRIRTYNFPQGRVTDHRVNLTLYSLERLMEGDGLDEIVDALTAERQAELLSRAGGFVTQIPRLPPFAPGMRIGLLGGSFNPPHEGHALVTRLALRRLGLDRVWWLVTPGNPLKSLAELAATQARVEAARRLVGGPLVAVTDIEARIGARYTYDTLAWIVRRAPGVHFVWIMGADNLRQFHLWRHWRAIADLVPIVVVDRPGSTLRAISSRAGAALGRWRVSERDAARFASLAPPAFLFLHGPRSRLSSTALGAWADPGAAWPTPAGVTF